MNQRNGFRLLCCVALGVAALCPLAHAAVWYVHVDNTAGPWDGTSWAAAFQTIQEGVDAAYGDGGGEVWVAEGVYDETRTSVMHNPPVDTGSVVMKENVHLYGGFEGAESSRDQRDWESHATIIDGSKSRGGASAYHVVIGADDAFLDGMTITGGNATSATYAASMGGGMYNASCSPTVANCIFIDNLAVNSGGGMLNINAGCSPTVSKCVFVKNRNHYEGGGAVHNRSNAAPTFSDCLIVSNTAWYAGGGIGNRDSSGFIERCVFVGNSAEGGGAIHNYTSGSTVVNCLIVGNFADNGSGIHITGGPQMRIVNSTITNNSSLYGGGIGNLHASTSPTVINAILWANTPPQIVNGDGATCNVLFSDVEGGYSGTGNLDADPEFATVASGTFSLVQYSSSKTTLTDFGASFEEQSLKGMILWIGGNASYICANDASSVQVWGSVSVLPPVAYEISDYHLQPGSPCVDAGTNYLAPSNDIDGDFRPYGLVVDIGADEAGGPSTPIIEVGPEAPTTADELVCTVTTGTIVSPGLTAYYEYRWTNDLFSITYGPTESNTNTLSPSYTRKHETWTCFVRGYDGYYFSDAAADSTTVLNAPPGTFTLSLPTMEGTSSNLRCWILDKSPDPDGDVTFEAQWYYMNSGDTEWTECDEDPDCEFWLDSVNYDWTQVDNEHTSEWQRWYCEVTLQEDGLAVETKATDPCQITPWGTELSYISLAVSPTEVILGQSVTASGQIFPSPDAGADVFFQSTSPSALVSDTFPEGLVIPGDTYSRTFVPTQASEGRDLWSLTASWGGDPTYMPATSSPVTFTVLKAEPSLSLELNASSVPLGYGELAAWAVLHAAIPAELRQDPTNLLVGRTVKLWLRKPDASSAGPVLGTTDADGVVTFLPADFAAAGIVFDEAGLWQFLVEFEGDDNFLMATSPGYDEPDSVRLTIKDRAGYAVIVLGKLDEDGEGHAEHAKTGDYVYRSMIERGLAHEDIYYLREGPEQPAPDIWVDDTLPTQLGVQDAIQWWAADKMNGSPAPLYVVCLDHGGLDSFYVYAGSYDDTRIVTPIELDAYLDALESALSGPALSEWIVVVMGCCHAGSFIPLTSGVNRVVMASCASDEVSHRGPIDPIDGLRDGEVFTTELFRLAREGRTLKASFEQASQLIMEYTATQSNGGEADNLQHAFLDDNGDGMGTVGDALSFEYGEDGAYAHELVLGYGVNAGESVGWITATQTLTLDPAEPVGVLEAKATEIPATGHDAWIEVKTPDYTGSTVIDPTNPDSQEAVEMVRFDYEPGISDLDNGYFRWQTFGTTFDGAGTYKVFYYIQDGDTDDVSSYLLTTIYRQTAGNQAPPAVTLIYPEDAAYTYSTSFFAWDEVADPEGGTVTYRLEIAEDDLFTTGLIVREGLLSTVTQVSGLTDVQTYYWRVIPLDEYGAHPDVHQVRTFTVDNDNPALPGAILGVVRDAITADPIAGADVTVTPGSHGATTLSSGQYFVGTVPAGTYTVQVTATGYQSQGLVVGVTSGTAATRDFTLEPADGTFRWGDLNADTKPATLDGSLILQWMVGIIDRFPIDESIVWPDYPPGGDVTGDEVLGVMDVSSILQYRVGIIDCFPADLNCDEFGPDGGGGGLALKAGAAFAPRRISVAAPVAGVPGEEIDVAIDVDDAWGVLGYYIELAYDATSFEYIDATKGTLTPAWGDPVVNPLGDRLLITGSGTAELAGSGSLLVVRFRVAEQTSPGGPIECTVVSAELNDGAIRVEVAP